MLRYRGIFPLLVLLSAHGQTACLETNLIQSPGTVNTRIGPEGGTISLPLIAPVGEPCAWSASATASWIEVLTPAGVLPGPVSVRFAANDGVTRSGRVFVGSGSLLFEQSGPCCANPILTPNFVAKQGPAETVLTADVAFACPTFTPCPWTAEATGAATLLSPASGEGISRVEFQTSRNCSANTIIGGVRVNLANVSYFQQPVVWYLNRVVLNTTEFAFEAESGQTAKQTVRVTAMVTECPSIPFTVADPGLPWLHVMPSSATTPADITVQADAAGLVPGVYTTQLFFQRDSPQQSDLIPVRFTVRPPQSAVALHASPSVLNLEMIAAGPSPAVRTVAVTSGGAATRLRVTGTTAPWLTATAAGTTPAAQVTVVAAAPGTVPGVYSGLIRVEAMDISVPALEIPVLLTVRPATAEPEEETELLLSQERIEVETEASGVITRTIDVTSNRFPTVTVAIAPPGTPWLQVSAAPMRLTLRITPAGLAPGWREALITVQGGSTVRTIPVRLNVISPIRLLPGQQTVVLPESGDPATLYLTASGRAVAFTATVDAEWLSVTPAAGNTPANLRLHSDPKRLQPGRNTATLTLRSPDAAEAVRIPVSIWNDQTEPKITVEPGPFSPGAFVHIAGRQLGAIGSTQVLLDGRTIALVALELDAILARLPMDAFVGESELRVLTPGGLSAPLTVHLQAASPVVLAAASGAGGVLTIFAHGLGPLDPSPDGTALLCRLPVRVEVGGVTAAPLFAGAVPEAEGVYRILVLQPGLPKGAYDMRIFAGEFASAPVRVSID